MVYHAMTDMTAWMLVRNSAPFLVQRAAAHPHLFQELVPGSFVWPLQHLQHTSANRWATHGALGNRLMSDCETWPSHVLSNNFNQYRGQWLIDVDCVDKHRIQIRPARPGPATEGCVFAQFSAEVNGFEWMRIWWSNIQTTRTNGTEGADGGTNPN